MTKTQKNQTTNPYYFCTYFDRNYLTRGLALHESLMQHCQNSFTLWILCFDDETHGILSLLNLPSVCLISQQEFEANDDALISTKINRSRVEYYWTCTPSLPLYILQCNPEVDVITYLDADLYFYSDPQPIYEEMDSASVLIIEHRYSPEYAHLAKTSGIYNVGWISFRRDTNGLACLTWWRGCCLDWCYARYEEGKFGDQLYLDDWPQRFHGVVVIQNKGAGLAPWNLTRHHFEIFQSHLIVDGELLIFFHFHGFHYISQCLVKPSHHTYRIPSLIATFLFITYAKKLEWCADKIQQSFADPGHLEPHRSLPALLLDQRLLLTQPVVLSGWLWRVGGWRRENHARIEAGFSAYQRGDLRAVRYHFMQVIWRNPFILCNLGIISLLVESVIGSPVMARYRTWRHGM